VQPNPYKQGSFLSDIVSANARQVPDLPALIFKDREYTWADFKSKTDGICRGLSRQGVVQGTRVAILDRNSDDFVFLGYALAQMGAMLVPINMWNRASEVRYVLNNCQPRILVVSDEFRALANEALVGLEISPIIVSRGTLSPGDINWTEIEDGPRDTDVSSPNSWDDPHLVLFTSGTTGRPKGALISHRRSVIDGLAAAGPFGIRRCDRLYCYLPLFHTGAWDYLKLYFMNQGSVVLVERFDANEAVQLIEKYRCNALFGVPLVLREITEAPNWNKSDMSSVRLIAYGSYDPSNFLEVTLEKFRQQGASSVQALLPYGLTEAGPFVSIARPHESHNHSNSLGTPVPGVSVVLLDDDCHEVPIGQIGEICVRSPALMNGYLNMPEATAEAFRGGWLHTGDLARQDVDGFLHMVDRKKDMIRTGGENVYAKEVEQVLIQHPSVADCAVVGLFDADFGEQVVAVVVIRTGETVNAEEIQAYVRLKIAGFKTPKRVVFMDELPKTPVGKISKNTLREMLTREKRSDGE